MFFLANLGAVKLSDKKKEHKSKLLGPDIFRWGGGLPREGMGAKKFGNPGIFLAGMGRPKA